MEEQPKHTPGPYEIRPVSGESDIEIYSGTTGESVASIHTPGWRHENAPGHGTALHNAGLFRAAPRLRESLATILQTHHEEIHPSTAQSVRSLLAELDAGPGEAFLKEREELERRYEETIQAQVDEMALQTKVPRPQNLDELDEDLEEEYGYSL